MSQTFNAAVSVVGIDIGKNSFHVVGHDERGAIVLRQKWSRGQVEARFANMPPCLVGMEACVGAHHLSCKLNSFGHDARLMPAKYVRPYSKGQKNDFRDAEAIAEAVQRPTMKFVATKTTDQLDLQALHRVRERLVSQRTGIINQIRAFLLERGIAVRQGLRFLRGELPRILATPPDVLSPRMVRIIEDLAGDWRRLDERVEGLSNEIEAIARQDAGCGRLMSVAHLVGSVPGPDQPAELQDLLFHPSQLSPECRETRTSYLWNPPVVRIGDNSEQLLDAVTPDRRNDPELGKMSPDRIDHRGPLTDEQMAGTVQHQAALLLGSLGRHEPHVGPGDRLANGLRVSRVILLPLDVGLHVGRRHQPHGVTQCL